MRHCQHCGALRLDTPETPVRGPYCDKCWIEMGEDAFRDFLFERLANEGADVEHLRNQEPELTIGELIALYNNVWEAKHALSGAVQP